MSRRLPLSRPRRGSTWIGIGARGFAIALLAAGAAAALKLGVPLRTIAHGADAAAVRLGLGVNQIAVTGAQHALSDDIFAALQLDQAGSLLSYDIAGARSRLEALPWVEKAQLSRSLPDGLDVTIRERQPFAVWQHKQIMFLIDAAGHTLEPVPRSAYPDLPLVVGDGADASASGLFDLLNLHPAIRGRLVAAVRVGGRRWDLQLQDAPTLMLPEERAGEALTLVERLQKDERLFERRIAAVDLRVEGRIAFQVAPEPSLAPVKPAPHPAGGAPEVSHRGA